MKDIFKKYSLILIVTLLGLYSCIEDFGGTGEPFNRVDQLQGQWQLSSVVQIDEIAKERNFPYQELNLTTILPYTEYKITFNINEAGVPSSFTTNKGNAPDVLGITNGTWKFDDNNYPSEVQFNAEAKSATLELGALNTLTSKELRLKKTRYRTNPDGSKKPVVSYLYIFKKI